jgi:NAD(P)-dependent dehydrogenase (short-subunit alcohol dehydrogenase family)
MANWLVTGVSGGLGRALAEAVLARGHKLVGTLRNESARSKFDELAPGRSFGIVFDITEEVAVRCGAEEAERITGGINVLVNNAGYALEGAIEEVSLAQVRAQFAVNVFGTVSVIQAMLPYMRKRRAGHIVNITAIGGLSASPSIGIYHGSKFALEGISEALSKEVQPLGISVTIVKPGSFRTDCASSIVHVERTIPDYDVTAGESRRAIAQRSGRQPGDPRKAAAAIIQAIESDRPPLHLVLGPDALRRAGEKLEALQAEILKWEPVSAGTNFAGE